MFDKLHRMHRGTPETKIVRLARFCRDRVQALVHATPVGRQIVVLAGGTAATQVLSVLTMPLLTRIYSPADFGVAAAYTSIVSIILVVAALRYELAIPLPKDDRLASHVLMVALTAVVLMSGTTALLMHWTRPVLTAYMSLTDGGRFLWLLPFAVFTGGFYQVFSHWATRKQEFAKVARSRVFQGLSQQAAQILLGLSFVGPIGLLVGDLLGRAGGSVGLGWWTWRQIRELGGIRSSEYRTALVRYRRFPLVSSASALINSVGLYLPPILLTAWFGPEVSGSVSLAQRLIGVPMTLIGYAVAQVYLGEAAKAVRQGRGQLANVFRRFEVYLRFGLIPITLMAVLSPALFPWVFGGQWQRAGYYVTALSAMYAGQFVVVPLSQTLNILERQGLQLTWDLGRTVTVIGSLYVGARLRLPPLTVIWAYSLVMLLAYVILLILCRVSVASTEMATPDRS